MMLRASRSLPLHGGGIVSTPNNSEIDDVRPRCTELRQRHHDTRDGERDRETFFTSPK